MLGVGVLGIWAAQATGFWQPLAIGLAAVVVELGFAEIARRRIKRAADPFHSWWTVIVFAAAIPLVIFNVTIILLNAGRIFPK